MEESNILLFIYLQEYLGNCLSGWHEIYEGAYINSVGASGAIFGIIGALFILVCIKQGASGTDNDGQTFAYDYIFPV